MASAERRSDAVAVTRRGKRARGHGVFPSRRPPRLALAEKSYAPTSGSRARGWKSVYRRLAREQVLRCATRQRVLEAFEACPGATIGRIAARLGVDYKTVAHHARVLAHFGALDGRREGRVTRFFPAGLAPRAPP